MNTVEGNYTVVNSAGSDYSVGAVFGSFDVKYTLELGYFPDGMVLRNHEGEYEIRNGKLRRTKKIKGQKRVQDTIEYRGQTKTIHEWAEHIGVSYRALYGRLYRGWPLHKAMTSEMRSKQREITVDGVTRNAAEWAEITGINPFTIIRRLNSGWSDEDAVKTPVDERFRHR